MAFHIDIVRIINADGVADLCEIDYSIDDCVRKGWLSLDGIWQRREIDIRALCHENERPDGPDVVPDPCFGQDQKLRLVCLDGRWVADMGDGLFLK